MENAIGGFPDVRRKSGVLKYMILGLLLSRRTETPNGIDKFQIQGQIGEDIFRISSYSDAAFYILFSNYLSHGHVMPISNDVVIAIHGVIIFNDVTSIDDIMLSTRKCPLRY